MIDKIYLASPHMSEEGFEKEYIDEAFKGNWIAPLGPNVDFFEKELATKIGIQDAVALSSGTAAIHMALKAAKIKKGDIVFCQSLTFSATANPIVYEGAIPVFIDSDKDTWNLNPDYLEKACKKYPDCKAVIAVHLYGLSADLNPILKICKENNLILIEDAAESLGTLYRGGNTGTYGDYGIFSFNGNKIITTSGGGMLVSNSKEDIEKVRFWSTQSRDPARHYQHSELGYNYRMSNILAGIGRGQLKILDKRIGRKKQIFEYYKRQLKDLKDVEFMPINSWNKPNYWLSCMVTYGKITPLDIIIALEKENIEARPIWKPMHMQPYFVNYDFIGDNVAEQLYEKGICLPSDTKMKDDDLEKICKIIKRLWE